MALVLLLLAGTLLTVLLLIPEKEKTFTDIDYLFPSTSREYIAEIELRPHGKDAYKVIQAASSTANATAFVLELDGVMYNWLTLDAQTLSMLVVGAGQAMTYRQVVSRPTDPSAFESQEAFEQAQASYDKRLLTYELTEEKASSYVLRTVTGEEYTVYYGKKNHAGSGYYVRLKGEDTVYVSATTYMGDFLAGEPEQFVVGTRLLPPGDNELAYAFPRRFEVSSFLQKDAAVEAEDILTLSVRLGDGTVETVYLDMKKASADTRLALLGKPLGDYTAEGITLSDAFLDMGGKAGERRTVTLLSIVEAERLWMGLRYLFPNEHDLSDSFGVYTFYAPSAITACRPNNGGLMEAFETLLGLSGKVVHIGLDEATMEKYGLYHQKILFEYPVFGEEAYEREKDEYGNDLKDEAGNYVYTDVIAPDYYLTGQLYVSAAKNGVCYVASTLYGFVAEVEISSLAFLYRGIFDLVSPYLFAGGILDISALDFHWNYGETEGLDGEDCHMDIKTHVVTNAQGNEHEELLSVTAKWREQTLALDLDKYSALADLLFYLRYAGESGLSTAEKEALKADGDAAVLTLTITMEDATTVSYRFVPYATNKMAVFLSRSGLSTQNDGFYVFSTDMKAFAAQYLDLMGLSAQ